MAFRASDRVRTGLALVSIAAATAVLLLLLISPTARADEGSAPRWCPQSATPVAGDTPCPAVDTSALPELRGDSNPEAIAGWTPPVPLETGGQAQTSDDTPPPPPPGPPGLPKPTASATETASPTSTATETETPPSGLPPTKTPTPTPSPTATPSPTPIDPIRAYQSWIPDVARDGPLPTPTPTPTPLPTATPTPTPVPTGPVVYLTFDDGPNPAWTPAVLEVLARYDARATFFVLGQSASTWPGLVAQEAAAGHSVGNHSWDHANLALYSWDGVASEIGSTQTAIANATGHVTTCFRPPYGSVNGTVYDVAAYYGVDVWLWDVDPADWSLPGVQAIVNNVLTYASPGSVILMHDGGGDRSQTVAALDIILSELSARGYRFAPLPCW